MSFFEQYMKPIIIYNVDVRYRYQYYSELLYKLYF
jgi:hypothetical protein